MKDATNETNLVDTRRAKGRYISAANLCLDLPVGQCTRSKVVDGQRSAEVIDIETATNEQLAQCIKMLGFSMPKAGDSISNVLSNTKVQELLEEFMARNGRIVIQNPEFVTTEPGVSPSCFWFPNKNKEDMLTPDEMVARRSSKLAELKRKFTR